MKKTTNAHLSFVLPVGSELFGKYRILKVLSNTQYGFDYLVTSMDNTNKKTYLIKEFFPNGCVIRGDKNQMLLRASLNTEELLNFNFMRKIFEGEVKNLAKISDIKHTNIVNLIEVLENKNNTTYMVRSYEEGISLSEYLDKKEERRLSNEEIYNIIYPLFEVLEDIYKLDIYHLDIKPENIFIKKDGTLILVGFHASTIFYDEHSKKYRNIFTPEYASPEQINVENISEVDQRSDIYSVGVLLYYLITNTLPPKAEARKKSGKNDPYTPLLKQEFSYEYDTSLLATVDKALSVSKKNRFKNLSQFKNAITTIKPASKQKRKNERKNSLYIIGFIASLFVFFIYFTWEDSPEKLKPKTSIENRDIVKQAFSKHQNKIDINSIEKQNSNITKTKLYAKHDKVIENKNIVVQSQNVVPVAPVKTLKIETNTFLKEVKNGINIQINVNLPSVIGQTKVKVNGKEYSDDNIFLKREESYEIIMENSYYQPLRVTRTYEELMEFPVQNFILVRGKGKLHLDGLPMNTQIKVYEVDENQKKEFNPHILYKNGMYEMIVKSGTKIYMVFNNNKEYKSYQTEIITLLHGEALTLTYSLEKKDAIDVSEEVFLPVEKNISTQRTNNMIINKASIVEKKRIISSYSEKKISTKEKTKNPPKHIKKKNISKETISVSKKKNMTTKKKTKKNSKYIKKKNISKETITASNKKKISIKKKTKKNSKDLIQKNLSTKKNLNITGANKVSTKGKDSFVWYCSAKSIGSIKMSAKHINKLVAQQMALRACNKGKSGCKVLNCFLLRN